MLEFGAGDLLEFGTGGTQDIDFDTAIALALPRPTDLKVCVLGVDCPEPQPGPFEPNYHRFRLDWVEPSFGEHILLRYEVYRAVGNVEAQLVGIVPSVGRGSRPSRRLSIPRNSRTA